MFVDLNELPLPFDDSSADTLLLSDVLEHVMHPWELMEEVTRILRPGGVLLLNVPFYYPLHSIPYDYHRFTEFALRAMCARAGLDVIELAPTGGAPEILADVSSKVVSMLPKVGKGIARMIQGTTGLFVRGRFGRKVSTKTGRRSRSLTRWSRGSPDSERAPRAVSRATPSRASNASVEGMTGIEPA